MKMIVGSVFFFISNPWQINFLVLHPQWKYMKLLHEILIKENTPSFQPIFFSTLCYKKDCKKLWIPLKISIRIKKLTLKRMRNTIWGMKKCKFTPNLKSLNACFLSKMAHHFFVKLVTFLNVLVLVLTFCYLVKQEQGQFYYMKTFRTKITLVKIWKVPILSISVTEYAYHTFVNHTWR